jgi:hypothetical protein
VENVVKESKNNTSERQRGGNNMNEGWEGKAT